MVREPARQASGDEWMVPFLASLLEDPCDEVRYCAARSLRRIEGFKDLDYDHVGPPVERARAASHVRGVWMRRPRKKTATHEATLTDREGQFRQDVFSRLHQKRDDTDVNLAE